MTRFRYIPSFARPTGRGLPAEKREALRQDLQAVELRVEGMEKELGTSINIEIGYGSGEHLIHQAKLNPGTLFIGCEVYIHGIAAAVKAIKSEKLGNVRLFTEDARLLLDALPDGSLERVFILFPDPWPKARHHKRRIVKQETLALLHRVMKPGAELRLATDHPGYAQWMLAQLLHHGGFRWTAECKADWENPPEGHTKTRYEEKLKANHPPVWLNFKRN